MELTIRKGRMITEDGEQPHYGLGIKLDLSSTQAKFVAGALRVALQLIASGAEPAWDDNHLPLIQDAIDQLDNAEQERRAYLAQLTLAAPRSSTTSHQTTHAVMDPETPGQP